MNTAQARKHERRHEPAATAEEKAVEAEIAMHLIAFIAIESSLLACCATC